MKYGPIDVKVKKIGKPEPHDELLLQRFDVTLAEDDFSFTIRVPVLYEGREEAVVIRMGAWRAIDELRAAYQDPATYEEAARKWRERTWTEAQEIIGAAHVFGASLETAFAEVTDETAKFMEKLDYEESPGHWIPGNGHMNG